MADPLGRNDPRRVAIHEAGHAVIARKLRLPLRFVEVAKPGRRLRGGFVGGVQLAVGSTRSARKAIILARAGPWAERHVLGEYLPEPRPSDEMEAQMALCLFSDKSAVRDRLSERCDAEASAMVLQCRPAIEAVARALLKYRKLTGREVDLLIGAAEPWAETPSAASAGRARDGVAYYAGDPGQGRC
jgi:hypothetical protein